MKTLFSRILIWFLLTVLVTGGAVSILISLSRPEAGFPLERFRGMAESLLTEARDAYEAGDRTALASHSRNGGLTDSVGIDLYTGEDYSDYIAAAQGIGTFRMDGFMYFSRRSDDGRYWYIMKFPARPTFPLMGWRLIWVVPIVVLLCYLLARYLTAPVRKLEGAVRQFGAGNLSARADLTRRDELGRLAQTFDRMAQHIESLLAGKRQLLLDISHELRSPLTRLNLALELARSGKNTHGTVERIQSETNRLNALVGELLAMSRTDLNGHSLKESQSVRLDSLLRNLADTCEVEAGAKGCRLSLDVPQPVSVQGDQELLRRALENVIRNAILYAPQNTPIEIEARRIGAGVSVSVQDRGSGVPKDSLPHLFEPFYCVANNSCAGRSGTGLGLAIARRAVELHKGRISARNTDPGLMVEILLPAVA